MTREKVEYKIAKCEDEYSRKKELNEEDVRHLLVWSHKQPHLPNVTESQCIRYYCCNDYSLQRTKKFIELHFTFRHEFPEVFRYSDFEKSKYNHSIWDVIYGHKVEKLSPKGHTIVYAGLKDMDAKKFDWDIAASMFHKVLLSSAMEGVTDGYEFVLDMEGLTFDHVRMVTIPFVRKFLTYIQDAIEVRVKAVHVIRITPLLDKILILVKPFIRKELWDMLNFHADMKKFYALVPEEYISKDIPSGTLPHTRDELNEVSRARLQCFMKDLLEDVSMKTDEEKRLEGVGRAPAVTASFKKLDLD